MNTDSTQYPYDHVRGATAAMTEFRWNHHNSRFNQLVTLTAGANEGVWQYLLAVNGGAVAGMVGFIGAVAEYRSAVWSYIALFIFVLGLVIVGIARAHSIHRTNSVFLGWNSVMEKYYSGEITWSEALQKDEENTSNQAAIPWILGWTSFGLFLCGLSVVAYAMWKIGMSGMTV